MDSNFNNENDPWKFGLDIDDSDLHLTPVMRSYSSTRVESSPLTPNLVWIILGPAGIVQLSSSTRVEPSPSTPNPVRIILGPAGIVQQAKLLKEKVFILNSDGALMSTQEYMQKVIEDVGEDDDFKSGVWISATNYVTAIGGTITRCLGDINNFLKKGKLNQVVAIVKSCSPNVISDLAERNNRIFKDSMKSSVEVFKGIVEVIKYKLLGITMKDSKVVTDVEDKRSMSVERTVRYLIIPFQVFSIWKAFGGNTRDLGSFGEETDKTMDLHQHLLRISTQQLETASQIKRDAVTTHTKTASQDLKTASEFTTQPII
ncbi:hypothetical protein Tco_1426564 [Tanacetum coccineum]